MAKRKTKLKYKNIFIAIVAFILLIVGIVYLFIKIKNRNFKVEIYNKEIIVNEAGTIDIDFKATYKGKDVTKLVKESEFVINPKKDKYEITFTYKNYKNSQKIEVKDEVKPEIVLKKGTVIVKLGEKYIEPGVSAKDNLDKNLTSKIEIKNNVNLSKEGEYYIKYTVKDSSGNKSEKTRKVIVSSTTPLDADLKNFSLNGYFEDTILKETEDVGKEYADSFIYAGDSTFLYYPTYQKVKNLWIKKGANSETMLTENIDVYYKATDKTLVETFKEKKPEKVILALGENCVAVEQVDFFIANYKKLLTDLKEASPETLIIVQSILPVPKKTSDKGSLTNDKINKFNYYLAELCEEMNVPFLNVAEVLKDSEGHLKSGYEHPTDINHIGKNGINVIHNYIRTHAYIEK